MRTRSECFPPLVPPEPGTTHAQVFIMPIARKLRPWVYLSGLAAFGSAACGSSDARPPLAETDPTPGLTPIAQAEIGGAAGAGGSNGSEPADTAITDTGSAVGNTGADTSTGIGGAVGTAGTVSDSSTAAGTTSVSTGTTGGGGSAADTTDGTTGLGGFDDT